MNESVGWGLVSVGLEKTLFALSETVAVARGLEVRDGPGGRASKLLAHVGMVRHEVEGLRASTLTLVLLLRACRSRWVVLVSGGIAGWNEQRVFSMNESVGWELVNVGLEKAILALAETAAAARGLEIRDGPGGRASKLLAHVGMVRQVVEGLRASTLTLDGAPRVQA